MIRRRALATGLLAAAAGATFAFVAWLDALRQGERAVREACVASAQQRASMRFNLGAGGDTYIFTWIGERGDPPQRYVGHLIDPESPRSLQSHDRLILRGRPRDWIAAASGDDLVICRRDAPAALVVKRHFCTGPLAAKDVKNGEIEEITFLGGVTWLADDLAALAGSRALPAELAEELRGDFERELAPEASEEEDAEKPDARAQARRTAALLRFEGRIARWSLVPMSAGLGAYGVSVSGRCGR